MADPPDLKQKPVQTVVETLDTARDARTRHTIRNTIIIAVAAIALIITYVVATRAKIIPCVGPFCAKLYNCQTLPSGEYGCVASTDGTGKYTNLEKCKRECVYSWMCNGNDFKCTKAYKGASGMTHSDCTTVCKEPHLIDSYACSTDGSCFKTVGGDIGSCKLKDMNDDEKEWFDCLDKAQNECTNHCKKPL